MYFNKIVKDSTQQIIPIKASLNKSNISSFKNGTGLIDVNKGPENTPSANTYAKNLNEMNNQNKSSSSSSGSSERRNSATGLASSEKSSAESSAKVVDSSRRPNFPNRVGAASLANNKFPTEPIELFKKINELSRNSKQNPTSKLNSLTENKKRLNLLLHRKN